MTTYVIGDLHGHHRDYEHLLREAELCDADHNWTGGTAHLWLMGDFFDRGASGVKCVELTMKLQAQARDAGGMVNSLLGNHEMMLLAARRFGDSRTSSGLSVFDTWLRWGGIESDFQTLTDEHAAWLEALPAMVLVEDHLMVHADAMLYVNYGTTIDQVNQGFRRLLASDDLHAWEQALSAFGEHMAFSALEITGQKRAEQLLALYGGRTLVHGHTPIPYARQIEAESVTEAWVYANNRCINVDGGMYMGSPGFVYQLS